MFGCYCETGLQMVRFYVHGSSIELFSSHCIDCSSMEDFWSITLHPFDILKNKTPMCIIFVVETVKLFPENN